MLNGGYVKPDPKGSGSPPGFQYGTLSWPDNEGQGGHVAKLHPTGIGAHWSLVDTSILNNHKG